MEDQALDTPEVYVDDDVSFFQDIDDMQAHGINAADLKKLKGAGICTVKGVQMTTRRRLCNIKGLSEAKVDKIKEVSAKLAGTDGFMTALAFSVKRRQVFRVSTGSLELDKLLGGGIESMAITEVFGEFRTGKTQLSHTLCVTSQMPNNAGTYTGGKNDNFPYLATEKVFPTNKLQIIIGRANFEYSAVVAKIKSFLALNSSENQYLLIFYIKTTHYKEDPVFKLLIVDSVMALFRVDFSGRGELADRQQRLAQYMSRLQKISEEYNVSVFITNQMTSDPGAGMSFQADPKKPIGGHILAHASTTRVSLRKGRGETRIAKIYDSPELPECEATFAITAGGIADAKE
ncbi:unnamed protein product, partial [Meganyctiphanes norvegica]